MAPYGKKDDERAGELAGASAGVSKETGREEGVAKPVSKIVISKYASGRDRGIGLLVVTVAGKLVILRILLALFEFAWLCDAAVAAAEKSSATRARFPANCTTLARSSVSKQ